MLHGVDLIISGLAALGSPFHHLVQMLLGLGGELVNVCLIQYTLRQQSPFKVFTQSSSSMLAWIFSLSSR